MSTSDDDGRTTPPHTTLASDTEAVEGSLTSSIEISCPWPGGKYIIRETESKLVIALKNGGLGLYALPTKETVDYDLGFYWNCVENDKGWLGLRNTVSGGFIGLASVQSSKAKISNATSLYHTMRHSFCARQHPDSGYVLLFIDTDDDDALLPMTTSNERLTFRYGKVTRWEFIKVDSL
ncbi:uncharacterized protein BO95DRAFT_479139 [Aspergillus brunneoviolaceus CBS 621.78]|uniref:Uncharacterized protein n=1 Tax=Aspergillus brunneoviolaceus CBS 621.78 TaxID=1450534 RepID=A0ACD1GKV0_9EURO|nr:hypothetical protein BO95DRAFT_479139 [Aspergillus brunneoviolaceus CBS 621.78]RAH49865.1 hypothetical protein BO95DRAFT_479139 [Aspergillus brunneoviolaceus CBS 621.78]